MAFEAAPQEQDYVFRLFVAGDEQHSRRAKENLKAICQERLEQPYEIEILDVLESYQLALENKIFLTPALVMISPSPTVTIFGNLSDTEEVIRALRLGGKD
jgi:circadian clock protein KaiB